METNEQQKEIRMNGRHGDVRLCCGGGKEGGS